MGGVLNGLMFRCFEDVESVICFFYPGKERQGNKGVWGGVERFNISLFCGCLECNKFCSARVRTSWEQSGGVVKRLNISVF